MKIREVGELGFIEWVKKNFATPPEGILGIGDDTAVIKSDDGYLLITKDLLIEDVHFTLSHHPPHLLGRKSMAVNISDIASMGGEPLFALLGVGFPRDFSWEWIEKFMEGIKEICEEYGVYLIGGDTCASPKLFISVTLIGRTEKAIMRSSAKEGDYIYVTGSIGDSGAGLYIILNNLPPEKPHLKYLLKRHLDPTPRVSTGRFLQKENIASSMIDLSDGLSIDLHNLCRESGVGALIDSGKIPITEELIEFCKEIGEEPVKFALQGGEDYELLFTSPIQLDERLKREHSITLIGRIEGKEKGIRILKNGEEKPLPRSGWEHF